MSALLGGSMPLLELAPNVKSEYPEIWRRILNKLDAPNESREQLT
jgi:hypothetical protein